MPRRFINEKIQSPESSEVGMKMNVQERVLFETIKFLVVAHKKREEPLISKLIPSGLCVHEY